MCDIGLALTIGSTVLAGVGQIQQASATQAAANYNAQVATMNATLANRRAKDALERGATAEQQKRMEVAQLQGRQQAAMAANGVDITFGSPLDTLVDTAARGELDALTIRRNAAKEAYDYKVQGVNYQSNALLDVANGNAAMTGGYLNAAGTVLGGAGQAYKDYKQPTIGAIG